MELVRWEPACQCVPGMPSPEAPNRPEGIPPRIDVDGGPLLDAAFVAVLAGDPTKRSPESRGARSSEILRRGSPPGEGGPESSECGPASNCCSAPASATETCTRSSPPGALGGPVMGGTRRGRRPGAPSSGEF